MYPMQTGDNIKMNYFEITIEVKYQQQLYEYWILKLRLDLQYGIVLDNPPLHSDIINFHPDIN